VPRATLYRTHPHLKVEFDQHLGRLREVGKEPESAPAQVERLKSEVMGLRDRLSRANAVTAELEAVRHTALSRLVAQHEEITALRRDRAAIRASPLRPGDS
jgi:chromosome segregation ATPase